MPTISFLDKGGARRLLRVEKGMGPFDLLEVDAIRVAMHRKFFDCRILWYI